MNNRERFDIEPISTKVATTQPCFKGLEPLPAGPGRAAALDDIASRVRAARFPAFSSVVLSAHQMGTCRMGVDRSTSVVSPAGECWDL